jgi:uncharacterized membrane-anchored protein
LATNADMFVFVFVVVVTATIQDSVNTILCFLGEVVRDGAFLAFLAFFQ